MEKKRILYLDNIKAFACILVVLQHVAAYGYLYTETGTWNDHWVCNHPENLERYVYNIILIAIAKAAVPLFIMVNGALMLDKDITYKTILKKYILRCIKVLLFWNIFMAICTYMDGGTINDVLSVLIFGYQQFWFIYTLIGLYLVQPLLREIVKQEKILKAAIFMFVVALALNSIEEVLPGKFSDIILHLASEIGISDFPKWCGYYCLGYYLKNKENSCFAHIKFGGGIVILSIVYSIYMSSQSNIFHLESIEVFSLSTLIISIVVFLMLKKLPKNERKILSIINRNSFFIYAGHCLLIEIALYNHISLDLFNLGGLGVIIGTICIVVVLIMLKVLIIDRLSFLKGFFEW